MLVDCRTCRTDERQLFAIEQRVCNAARDCETGTEEEDYVSVIIIIIIFTVETCVCFKAC